MISLLCFCTFFSTPDLFEVVVDRSQDTTEVEHLVTHWIQNELAPNDVLIITDAATNQRIVTLRLSSQLTGVSAAVRRKVLLKLHRAELATITRYFQSLTPSATSPSLFEYLEGLQTRSAEFPHHQIHVIWTGPIMFDHATTGMGPCRYPSDAYISHPTSPWWQGKYTFKNIQFHLITQTLSDCPDQKELHREKIQSFYAKYFHALRGSLRSFQTRFDHLRNIKDIDFPPIQEDYDPDESKPLVSYRLSATTTDQKKETPPSEKTESIPTDPNTMTDCSPTVLWNQPLRTPQPINLHEERLLKIGIRWNAPIDLDLWVKLQGDDRALSWRQPTSDHFQGRHHKDYRSAPKEEAFEMVSYARPVALDAIELLAINHYSGSNDQPLTAHIRLWFGEDVYEHHFIIPPGTGSAGEGKEHPEHPSWVHLQLADFFPIQGL